jgi:ubiquinone/menaquinone biosynthesis C-methylase UbiE
LAIIKPFEENTEQYENWFERYHHIYQSELSAIKKVIHKGGRGIEIGVGTGRFAAPLGIKNGIDPSSKMGKIAKDRGISIINGIAEKLPYNNLQFDYALMVTTICFLDDIDAAFNEVNRILKQGGYFIIGFVDKDSSIGKSYQQNKADSIFYKEATFYSVPEVIQYLKKTRFTDFKISQTIFKALDMITETEPVKQGYGEGSFIVIKSQKKE